MSIKASAIKFYTIDDLNYPIIMTGFRHGNIWEKMFEMGIKYDKSSVVQGFINDQDQFLDRYDAKYEAERCHQIQDPCDSYRELFSEDIWPLCPGE